MTLVHILIACLLGSTLSALLAAMLAWRIRAGLIPVFVSYAVGALLGVVFLDLLPHIFEQGARAQASAAWLLAGILLFFILEKFVLWRHGHEHTGNDEDETPPLHAHHHDHHHATGRGRTASAWMVIIGDAFHNFTDGLAIAAAFVTDFRLGVATAIAIIAHELPHELGDFLVLIHSGFSKMRALAWNLVSSLATLLGALLAYAALRGLEDYALIFLCLAASSMIYVAIADLMPGLQKRAAVGESLLQIGLMALGIVTIVLVNWLVH
ncbi:MAG TPA: ZIP family metal transporter [Usitatibacteraceae bacterium]